MKKKSDNNKINTSRWAYVVQMCIQKETPQTQWKHMQACVCVCVTFKDWGPVLIPYFLTTDVCVWHSQQTNWWLPFYLSAYFPHSNCPICALGPNSLASWSFTNWWHKGSGEALLVLYNVLQHLNIRPVLIYNNTIRLRNSFANNIEKKKENPDVNLCWEKAAVSLLLALFPWGTPLRSCEQFPHH